MVSVRLDCVAVFVKTPTVKACNHAARFSVSLICASAVLLLTRKRYSRRACGLQTTMNSASFMTCQRFHGADARAEKEVWWNMTPTKLIESLTELNCVCKRCHRLICWRGRGAVYVYVGLWRIRASLLNGSVRIRGWRCGAVRGSCCSAPRARLSVSLSSVRGRWWPHSSLPE